MPVDAYSTKDPALEAFDRTRKFNERDIFVGAGVAVLGVIHAAGDNYFAARAHNDGVSRDSIRPLANQQNLITDQTNFLDTVYRAVEDPSTPEYVASVHVDGKPHDLLPTTQSQRNNTSFNQNFTQELRDPTIGPVLAEVQKAGSKTQIAKLLLGKEDLLNQQGGTIATQIRGLQDQQSHSNIEHATHASFEAFGFVVAGVIALRVSRRIRRAWHKHESVRAKREFEAVVADEAWPEDPQVQP